MKKLLLTSVAFAALGAGAPAIAADFAVPRHVAYVGGTNWTGCHVGGSFGYESGQNDGYGTTAATTLTGPGFSIPLFPGVPLTGKFHMDGFIGGGYGGCDYQFGAWVLGIEGDWSMMNNAGQSFPTGPILLSVTPLDILNPKDMFQTTEHWLATARGRLGYAVDKWLFFVSGGAAWARIESNHWLPTVGPATTGDLQNDIRTGWTVGAGLEYALSYGWSVRSEYLYVTFPSYTTFDSRRWSWICGGRHEPQSEHR